MPDNTTPTHVAASSDWRVQVKALVKRAEDVIDETAHGLDLDQDNGAYARQLLFEAQRVLVGNRNILQTADDPYEYSGDALLPAIAMLMGARDMKNAHRALPCMLEPAIIALEDAWTVIDNASVKRVHVAEATEAIAA